MKLLLSLFILVLSAGFAAFTTPVKKTAYTYQYNGPDVAGEKNPLNYTLAASPTGCSEFDDDMVCFIETSYAPDGSNHPTFTNGTDPRAAVDIDVLRYRPLP